MMGTVDILNVINENGADNFLLKIKNSKTGKMLGFNYKYVANEILFLFADKDSNGTCLNLKKGLQGESCDNCWDCHIDNIEDLSIEEIIEKRYEIVTELELRVYVGDEDKCPIANFQESFNIQDIEVTDNSIILVY